MSVTSYQFWATTIALIFCITVVVLEIAKAYFEWQQEKRFGFSEEPRNIEKAQWALLIFSVMLLMSIGGA